MRRWLVPLSALALGLVSSVVPSHAGTLTSATWSQVIQQKVPTLPGGILTLPMTRSSAQLGASGTATSTSVSVSLSYPAFATTVFLPQTSVTFAMQVTQGGPQAITATPGMATGSPGVPGTVVLVTGMHGAMGVDQSMFVYGPHAPLFWVPLSHGKAAFANTYNFLAVGIRHWVTVDFYAWTPGTLLFTGLTSRGTALPDVAAMGSFNVTPQGGGTVTLVAPSKLSVDGFLFQRRTASFVALKLTFVPEPGTLLLLGGAALALLLRARRTPPTGC